MLELVHGEEGVSLLVELKSQGIGEMMKLLELIKTVDSWYMD